jgi:hypothetical protein
MTNPRKSPAEAKAEWKKLRTRMTGFLILALVLAAGLRTVVLEFAGPMPLWPRFVLEWGPGLAIVVGALTLVSRKMRCPACGRSPRLVHKTKRCQHCGVQLQD